VKPDVLPVLRDAMLIRLHGGTVDQQMKGMELLPANNIVHFSEYLLGGFDKQYPDHVPPRESWGTPEQFSAFYARGRELGHLMMPYTNTSWWCIDPKGPTFEREGEAPLARSRDRSIFKERYGPGNEGHKVCFWHPAVQEAHRTVRHQMTAQYPSDVLFQDQVGARAWYWDYNEAAPTPTAALDGMYSLSMEDAAVVPLATEDGYDRVIEFETMLCGMAWAVVPSGARHERRRNAYHFPEGDWENYPLVQYLAHDRVIFMLHDLGHFVTDREKLAWVLGLGYGLSYVCDATGLGSAERMRWLAWLDALQKNVCSRYAGLPLLDYRYPFREDDGSGGRDVIVTSYPGMDVVVNTGREPVAVADIAKRGEEGLAVPSALPDLDGFGFYVSADGLRAGALRDPQGDAYAFCARYASDRVDAVVRAPVKARISLPLLPGCRIRKTGTTAFVTELHGVVGEPESETAVRTVVMSEDRDMFRVQLPESLAGGDHTKPMPAALQGVPASRWSSWSKRIAVIALDGEPPSSWVHVTGGGWLKALEGDTVLADNGFEIVALGTVEDIVEALHAKGDSRPFAIVNPGGEYFYAPSVDKWQAMLDAIGAYVQDGGIWWETGGYSFHSCAVPVLEDGRVARWEVVRTGPAGATRLGFGCASFDVDEPDRALTVTSSGREWLGPERRARIEALSSGIQRGFAGKGTEDTVLVQGGDADFAAAIRCGGWGWLWRLGGFNPDPEAATDVVTGVLEHLATQPWTDPRTSDDLRLWRVRIHE